MKNIKPFSVMLVLLCGGLLVSCGGYSSFKAAKNTSAVSPDNKVKSSSSPEQTDIKADESKNSDDSENKGSETTTEQPQKKNVLEELSGEIGCCKASGWEKKIDEDERYIFILSNEKSILRIDKDTNERICIAKASKDSFIEFLYLYKEGLYYVLDQGELYRYNLTTGETKQIYVEKEFLEPIFGMQIYKDNIYLHECGLGISRLDPETNTKKELVEDNVSHGVFYNNKLYYIKRRHTEKIRCLDLDSGRDAVARKLEDKESHYAELFTYRNQLCYVLAGQQRQIRILGEKGEDSLLLSLEKDQVWREELIDHFDRIINYDENLLYYVYTKAEQSWLCCYDEGEKFQMKLPEDYWEGGYVCDGYFFYNTSQSRGYISKCVPING